MGFLFAYIYGTPKLEELMLFLFLSVDVAVPITSMRKYVFAKIVSGVSNWQTKRHQQNDSVIANLEIKGVVIFISLFAQLDSHPQKIGYNFCKPDKKWVKYMIIVRILW